MNEIRTTGGEKNKEKWNNPKLKKQTPANQFSHCADYSSEFQGSAIDT